VTVGRLGALRVVVRLGAVTVGLLGAVVRLGVVERLGAVTVGRLGALGVVERLGAVTVGLLGVVVRLGVVERLGAVTVGLLGVVRVGLLTEGALRGAVIVGAERVVAPVRPLVVERDGLDCVRVSTCAGLRVVAFPLLLGVAVWVRLGVDGVRVVA
jgi:hypothetical protein